ncbi:unnamed protein product, partial [Leptidea sinapis]
MPNCQCSPKCKAVESVLNSFSSYKRLFDTKTGIVPSDMDYYTLVILANLLSICFAWSLPFYNVRRPVRVTRFAPMPQRLQLS